MKVRANDFVVHYFSIVFYRPQRSCGKVIFSQASVSHSVPTGVSGRHQPATPPSPGQTSPLGRHLSSRHPLGRHPLDRHPPLAGRHPPWANTPPHPLGRPPQRDGHCSERYASYWNAFLFFVITKGLQY